MQSFEIVSEDSSCSARRGVLHTTHGDIQTPVFMPVGTSGAVKGITPALLTETETFVVLANTYHLMLRPGVDVVERLGGVHRLMSWHGPILTDSGGYQIFSLSSLSRIDDNGVEFASHIDGEKIYLNAELATKIQNCLGADIIMCFDECTPFACERARLEKAVERTIRWAKICKETHRVGEQLLFGIVQGGIDQKLRRDCAEELVRLDFDGYAVGGLSVGEDSDKMLRTVQKTAPLLPREKPRYLMGVGTPNEIIAAVRAGIDMFDCVLPSRNGRNAYAFTDTGPVRLRNNIHIDRAEPLQADCDCYCCRNFSRGALRHFFNISEMLGPILTTVHNLRFYQRLMTQIRQAIERNEFERWAGQYSGIDGEAERKEI
jgi:queuine tRNA-ribosyltransferase